MTRNDDRKRLAVAVLAVIAIAVSGGSARADHEHTTGTFHGAKVNGGTVTHSRQGSAAVLTLSDDFQVPDTPDPHWQVVDSNGTTYLLQRLALKGDKVSRSIVVPAYVKDVASVQIWCAYAETVLGEASFEKPVR